LVSAGLGGRGGAKQRISFWEVGVGAESMTCGTYTRGDCLLLLLLLQCSWSWAGARWPSREERGGARESEGERTGGKEAPPARRVAALVGRAAVSRKEKVVGETGRAGPEKARFR
jgi:hypothetical protein